VATSEETISKFTENFEIIMLSNWIDSTYFCFSNSFLTRKNSELRSQNSELSSLQLGSIECGFKVPTLRVSSEDTLGVGRGCPVDLRSPLGWETRLQGCVTKSLKRWSSMTSGSQSPTHCILSSEFCILHCFSLIRRQQQNATSLLIASRKSTQV
jgi:hypothetical protein